MLVLKAGRTLMLNNFLRARAGEWLGVIKFVADLRKSGKDTVLERVISREEIVSFNVVVPKALQLAFSRHLSDD
jgi:hypothetical protein